MTMIMKKLPLSASSLSKSAPHKQTRLRDRSKVQFLPLRFNYYVNRSVHFSRCAKKCLDSNMTVFNTFMPRNLVP